MTEPAALEDAPTASPLVRGLCGWVDMAQRRAGLTAVVILAVSVLLGIYATRSLGFNVDPNALFSADLRFQKMIVEFSRYFPVLTDSLLVVVDGATPEATRDAQQSLSRVLAEREGVFHRVFLPGEEPFFERTGLLYGSVEELDEFADHMALLQPVLGELSQDPTLPTLARVIRLGVEALDTNPVDAERWERVLDHFRSATVAVFDEYPVAVSWESVLLADSGLDPTTLRVIVADPILERERILAAGTAIEAVREEALRLGLGPERGVRVRITGYPALNHEEMLGLAQDTALAGGLSLLLVVLVLARAFRSLRMVLAAALTLIVGLVWSAAFAGATVAELNPLSIAFGVLVIGLGVDFMIHLGMHFADWVREGLPLDAALRASVRDCGAALVLCAVTTAVGFLAFVPTDYRGVSDLGLVASGGMLGILFQTLTLFPALLRLLLPAEALAEIATQRRPSAPLLPVLRPVPVCLVAGALGLVALFLLPRVDLDTNVVRLRSPKAESVQAFEDLLDSRESTPWYLDALTPSLDEAQDLAVRLRALPSVDRVVTLADFVPEDQEEKLEILGDVALFLDLPEVADPPPMDPEEQIQALEALRDFLSSSPLTQGGEPLSRSGRQLRDALARFLVRVETDGDDAVAELDRVLLDPLPRLFERLSRNIEVGPITQQDLPPGLVERMLAPDGHARVQVYPSEDLWDHDAMVRFVESIRPLSEDITGLPVNLVESARATWDSLRKALLWSGLAIAALLLALWRRLGDTLIALGPLLLAVLLTQASTVVLPVSFNFGNVIVLPLLLGVGVDSGVHLVSRAHELAGGPGALLSSTTARAVLFSALTTAASFGSLAISSHRGIASLGVLLVIGMGWTLAANLLLLPALLTLRGRAG